MRVPQEVRDSVVYVYDGDKLLGTGFLVGMPEPSRHDQHWTYLITARHVIQGAHNLRIRVNSRDNSVLWIAVASEQVWESDGPNSDVAAALLSIDRDRLNPMLVHINMIADRDYLERWDVGSGDDVVFAGLFRWAPGDAKNLPVIRFGQIARMNEELVETVGPGATRQRPRCDHGRGQIGRRAKRISRLSGIWC
jgi:hypothetical protein